MKKRFQKEETHTSSDLKRYLGALRKERIGVMKKILSPDIFSRFERRVSRFALKIK